MTPQSDNARAALMMVASMAAFAVEDLFLKTAASALPPGQVLALTGGAGALIFWAIAARQGERVLSLQALRGAALVRTLSEAAAAMLYITALALVPLSVNAALLQASPLLVTMGAALVLGEKVGWRRWSAIGLGFLGVLIILRPGAEGFQLAGLLTVGCVVVLAARDLATRTMPASVGSLQLSAWAYIGMVPAGLLLMLIAGDAPAPVAPARWAQLGGALISGIAGYYLVVLAMRRGEVSVVAPFRYTRLVFVVVLAMIFLGERPDGWTLTGSALVILSGLYAFARERRRRAG